MKKKLNKIIFIGLFLLSFFLPLGLNINSVIAQNPDINYEFNRDTFYQNNSVNIDRMDTSYNIQEQKEITGHYNATYSFENEVGLTNLQISYIDEVIGGTTDIIDSWYGHNEVLRMNSWEAFYSNYSTYYSYFSMEYWFYKTDQTESTSIRFYDDSTRILIMYAHENDNWVYRNHKGGYDTLGKYETNVWYHLRFNFYSDSHFDFIVNGITIVNNQWCEKNMTNGINRDYHEVRGNDDIYIDAIGYSWNKSYIGKYFTFNDFELNDKFQTSDYDNFTITKESNNCNSTIKGLYPILDDKYLELNNTDSVKGLTLKYTYYNQIEGYSIFHFKTNDTYKVYTGFSYGKGSTTIISLGIFNNDLNYYDGGWFKVDDITNNTWYKVKVYWYSSNETYDLYLNDTLSGNYDYMASLDSINYFFIDLPDTYKVSIGVDNIQINDYLILGYQINDNLLPYKQKTGYYEVDKYDWLFKEKNLRNPIGQDNPNGWSDIEPSGDEINIATFDNSNDRSIEFDYDGNDISATRGIYKDYNIDDCLFINISYGFRFSVMDNPNAKFYLRVYSNDSSTISFIRITQTGNLDYYNGSDYVNLVSGIGIDDYCEFEYLINYEIDKGFLNFYINSTFINSYIFVLAEVNKNGLSQIKFAFDTFISAGNDFTGKLNYVKIKIDAKSINNAYGYLTKNSGISNNLDIRKHNLIDITAYGNIFLGFCNNSYVIEGTLETFFDLTLFNNTITTRNGYDKYNQVLNNIIFVFYIKGSNFSISSYEIHGVKLKQNIIETWLDYKYSGINIHNSYFYVDLSNKLNFKHISDDTNTEYIQASFSITSFNTYQGAIVYTSIINNNAKGFLRVNYTDDTSNLFEFDIYLKTSRILLTQNKTCNSFIILISDLDDNSVSGLTYGYITDISIIFTENIQITIITLSLLAMMIPLIIILTPTFALSIKLGKNAIVPLFLLMSLVCVATSIIPIWVFFIIAISCSLFIFQKNNEVN